MSTLDTYMALFVGRRNDFAIQLPHGGYARVGRALTAQEVYKHLDGAQTNGMYVIDEHGFCTCAVIDHDGDDNRLYLLRGVQSRLAQAGIVSYPELSRRGWHLWIFLAVPTLASVVRRWLVSLCPSDMELYPKQNEGKGYGSLIRLPFGVHLRSGKRYPFVRWTPDGYVPVATSLHTSLAWLETVQRVAVPSPEMRVQTVQPEPTTNKETSFSIPRPALPVDTRQSIREWCAQQDYRAIIAQSVDLSSQGVGCCPFGWHHTNGRDEHASFKVYAPGIPGGYCWYCHVWQQGGSVFDFLRYSHNVDARTLWQEIQEGVLV